MVEGYSREEYANVEQMGGGKFVKGGPPLWRKTLDKYRSENPDLSFKQQLINAKPIYRRLKRRSSHKGAKLGKLRISIGSLTKNIQAIDFSMLIEDKKSRSTWPNLCK